MSGARGLARRWWAGELGPAGTVMDLLLAPAEAAYRAAIDVRGSAFDRGVLPVSRATIPVISVGNVAVGGTGKTPFANWLARQLEQRGRRPAVLHGGYADDEPELHRRWSPGIPVIVGRDRVIGAAAAAAAGADVAVLDDGFQHRRLHRDLDIVLVAAERWAMPARVLPRGPWREPRSALRRADLIVVSRKTAGAHVRDGILNELREFGVPAAAAHLRHAGWRAAGAAVGATPPAEPVLLVSGVAEPGMVADTATAAGMVVADQIVFGDHHDYSAADAARIAGRARGGPIVTTEKDWTKLAAYLGGEQVWLLRQEVILELGAEHLETGIAKALS